MADQLLDHTLALAEEVIGTLSALAETVSTAESLTAGLCCAALTTVAGSSAVVRGGLIVYATDLKHSLGGVPDGTLQRHGPVSEPTAAHLARGASARTSSHWGVSLTGVAGPASQDGHPPGTVWVGVHGRERTTTRLLECLGDRVDIRDQAVAGALQLLLERLREQNGGARR